MSLTSSAKLHWRRLAHRGVSSVSRRPIRVLVLHPTRMKRCMGSRVSDQPWGLPPCRRSCSREARAVVARPSPAEPARGPSRWSRPCGLRSLGRVLQGLHECARSIGSVARLQPSPSSEASVPTLCGHLTAKVGAHWRKPVAAPEIVDIMAHQKSYRRAINSRDRRAGRSCRIMACGWDGAARRSSSGSPSPR